MKNPLVITVGILALIGFFIYFMSHFWTEVLWFQQVGAQQVLWTGWIAGGVLWLVGFLIVFAVLALTVQMAYRHRPQIIPGGLNSSLRAYQQAIAPMRRLIFWGFPIVLGALTAVSLASNWRVFLMWLNQAPFNEVDPQFGIDISFYV